MRFYSLIISMFFMFSALHPANADRQERAQKAYIYAQTVVAEYRGTISHEKLFEADRAIETAWRDLVHYYGTNTPLSPDLALIRARSASSRLDKSRVSEAWQIALSLQPATLAPETRLTLNIAAATATGMAGDVQSASHYFAAARTFAFARDKEAKMLQLQLRLQELKLVGHEMTWRKLNDNLLDMRHFSEGFAMWTLPRLDALLGEAEIRLALEPEITEKREKLADLKSKIILLTKGMDGNIPAAYIDRVRNFYYTIADDYDL